MLQFEHSKLLAFYSKDFFCLKVARIRLMFPRTFHLFWQPCCARGVIVRLEFANGGCQKRIFSDNGTNFAGAPADLKEQQMLLVANLSDRLQAFLSRIVNCLYIYSYRGSSFRWLVGSGH